MLSREGRSESDDVRSPVRQLLADQNFRRFWIAQVLFSGANGTLRFTFIWLVITLSDWRSAEGLVALALGVPALLLSAPAGAWSDRVDRKRLFMTWTGATVVALLTFTLIIASGRATAWAAGIAALVIGATMAVNLPNLQAIVPALVPPERLMNAAALQNGGGQAAGFVGLALGGVAISLLGDWGGFALVTVATATALALMGRVSIPERSDPGAESEPHTIPAPSGSDETSGPAPPRPGVAGSASSPRSGNAVGVLSSIAEGARFGFGSDPLRTLLILAVMLGGSFSVMQISMPRVVEEVYGRGPSAAGLVLGAFGFGMLVSSALVAGRSTMRHGMNVARYIGVGLGLGQFLLSLAPNLWVALVVMVAWGLNAGVAMASHRTLMQTHTPPAMMGRVMGLMMLGFAGSLPIGALVSSVLAPWLGPVVTMRSVGLFTMVITISLTWRKAITRLT